LETPTDISVKSIDYKSGTLEILERSFGKPRTGFGASFINAPEVRKISIKESQESKFGNADSRTY